MGCAQSYLHSERKTHNGRDYQESENPKSLAYQRGLKESEGREEGFMGRRRMEYESRKMPLWSESSNEWMIP
jgi:hypothetical protein